MTFLPLSVERMKERDWFGSPNNFPQAVACGWTDYSSLVPNEAPARGGDILMALVRRTWQRNSQPSLPFPWRE